MIASDLVGSRMVKCEDVAQLFQTAAASLFPILSFNSEEAVKNKLSSEEKVVWIEGTVTVGPF